MTATNDELLARLAKIESLLASLVEQRTVKDWYSTAEVAAILGKAEFTVREWCRLSRVNAADLELEAYRAARRADPVASIVSQAMRPRR